MDIVLQDYMIQNFHAFPSQKEDNTSLFIAFNNTTHMHKRPP